MNKIKKIRMFKLDKNRTITMYTFLTQYHGINEENATTLNHLDLKEFGYKTIGINDINKDDIYMGNILLVRDRRKKYELYPNPLRLEHEEIFITTNNEKPKQKKIGGIK